MVKINTPHAAVIIWNYDDRLGTESPLGVDKVESTVVSTLSLISINTSKSKSNPQGTFQLALAPTRNWVSSITSGSWCAILMSNEPINALDFKKADPKKVKMIGKIESVRVAVTVDEEGVRKTQYLVTGVDWGHIFNNVVYIDNHIQNESDPLTQGQGVAVAIRNMLFGKDGVPKSAATANNLRSIIDIFGKSLKGLTEQGDDVNRLAGAAYEFTMPREMVEYFNFVGPDNLPAFSNKINKCLTLLTGRLKSEDKHDGYKDSEGILDPFSFQGTHTFWQLLLENSNPALNEMFCELRWEPLGLKLALYNRIKPFCIEGKRVAGSPEALQSFFQKIKTTEIDTESVIAINAGTNWRDKYNFVEVKPAFQDFSVFQNWYKQKSQKSDLNAFQREGFRPMIVQTKQFPINSISKDKVDFDALADWSNILKEWFFNTHRMLNGTLTIAGKSEYIAVGDNITFSADLVNPTPNINSASNLAKKNEFILAHVETVNHSFAVSADGARQYITTIQFVRGILVNASKKIVGDGILDARASQSSEVDDKNTKNVFGTSDSQDPDKKVRGN